MQVNQDQIVYSGSKKGNKYTAPPRDLSTAGVTFDTTAFYTGASDQADGGREGVSSSPVISNPAAMLETPFILGVEGQTVTVSSDGKSVVDVVLNVTDIPNATEFDVRITKSAGNL